MLKSIFQGTILTLLLSTVAHADNNKIIRVGFNPGPYKEQFQKGVAPFLIKKGYQIEYKDFS
ncbi:MAG: methionine-binding protein, partial [Mixta sp.]